MSIYQLGLNKKLLLIMRYKLAAVGLWMYYIILQTSNGVYGQLSHVPLNAAVKHEQIAEMKCSTLSDGNIVWNAQRGTAGEDIIARGKMVVPAMKDTIWIKGTEKGQFDLIINKTSKDAAMRYICQDPHLDQEARAELIVFESEPQCIGADVKEHTVEAVDLECRVYVSGNWRPRLKWKHNGQELHGNDTYTLDCGTNCIGSKLNIKVHIRQNEHRQYKCAVEFSETDKPARTTATNVPLVDLTCIAEVNVLPKSDSQDKEYTKNSSTASPRHTFSVPLMVLSRMIASWFPRTLQ